MKTPPNHYRQQLRERIVDTAVRFFIAHGIKAVKMDDIALDLSISKRTLYEVFENKEKLLFECVRRVQQQRSQELSLYAEAPGRTVIDIIVRIYRQGTEQFSRTNQQFYADLERYPRVVEFLRLQKQADREQFLAFMQRGVSEGLFRPDINYNIAGCLFDAIGDYMGANHLILRYSFDELFRNMFFVSLRGLCTSSGLALLDAALD